LYDIKYSAMKVLAFGEILWDIIEGEYHLGGAPFNFAAHVVKCGGASTIISAVGTDRLGKQAIDEAKALGVDVSLIATIPDKPTGTVDVFLANGQPDYTIHEGVAFDVIPMPAGHEIKSGGYDVFYFGSLAQRSTTSKKSLQWIFDHVKFRHVFYDINLRKDFYSKEIVENSLHHCSIFKINDTESKAIAKLFYGKELTLEEFARKIVADYKVEVIIITAAEKGCYLLKDNHFFHMPGEVVKVVDAVGAGDSFSAAFMKAYDKTGNVSVASAIANKVGAYVASSRGAIPPYSEEIKKLLA